MQNTYPDKPMQYKKPTVADMRRNAETFYRRMQTRRSVRSFSPEPIPEDVIENCILAAGSAPSGANRQPWHFVVVSDPETKQQIRQAAEKEEHEFYNNRAPQDWLDALAPLGTDESKPFLELAPSLIVVFAETHGIDDNGQQTRNYYVQESVGIATGMLISAVHMAGLVSLTHTPSPMKFLNSILKRPSNERPYLILVLGYPSDGCKVPDITRKQLNEIATFI